MGNRHVSSSFHEERAEVIVPTRIALNTATHFYSSFSTFIAATAIDLWTVTDNTHMQ